MHLSIGTVVCHDDTVHYDMILHTSLQLLGQNMNQSVKPQNTPHTPPWRVSYRVSFVTIWEKICRVIMALHCILYIQYVYLWPGWWIFPWLARWTPADCRAGHHTWDNCFLWMQTICRKLNHHHIEGIRPRVPYLPCVSMTGRALLAGYHRYQKYKSHNHCLGLCHETTGLILGLRPANERCCCEVTPSLIGWAQI